MKKRITIVLPTYNERENITPVLERLFAQAERLDTWELTVLVVDDNSPDGTAAVVHRLQETYGALHLLSGEKKGLGEAYLRGFAYARRNLKPDLLVQMDSDGQHDPSLLPLFVQLTEYDFDLVIGSRFAPGGSTPDFSLWRRFLSYTANALIRVMGGIPRIRDCTSGFRCFRAELLERCELDFLSTRGYSFQTSLLFELLRSGARVVEVPIIFPDRVYGQSKLAFRDQVEFLGNLLKIRFRKSRDFIRFSLVGTSGVAVNLGVYTLLTRGAGVPPSWAAPLGIEVSILSNFVLNNLWTFRDRRGSSLLGRLLTFHGVAGIAGGVNYLIFLFFLKQFGLFDILANLLGISGGIFINYYLNSLYTWKKTLNKDSSGVV